MANKEVDIENYTDLDLYAAFLPFLKKVFGKLSRFTLSIAKKDAYGIELYSVLVFILKGNRIAQ